MVLARQSGNSAADRCAVRVTVALSYLGIFSSKRRKRFVVLLKNWPVKCLFVSTRRKMLDLMLFSGTFGLLLLRLDRLEHRIGDIEGKIGSV